MKRTFVAAALAAVAFSAAGCVGPRIVNSIVSRDDRVKLVYYQRKAIGTEQGIVECKVDANGNLIDCRALDLEFR